MALNRKIAYIDLSTGKIEIRPIPIDVRQKIPWRAGTGCLPAL